MPWVFFILTHLSIDAHSQLTTGGEALSGGMYATAAFTLDVYGHVTDQMREASSMRMQAYIQEIMGQEHQ